VTALSYFIPDSALGILFVLGLIAWFVIWCGRLNKESRTLKNVGASFETLNACIPPLRQHQAWRDKERMSGKAPTLNPSQVLIDNLKVQAEASRRPFPPEPVRAQFEAIFLAGCDESSLDLTELSAATVQMLTRISQSLRVELALCVLTGILGALLALVHAAAYSPVARPLGTSNAFAPAIWSFLLALTGGILYLRFQTTTQNPVLSALRRVTTTVWVPKLYPTVAQRAAQWAVQTLGNAARVTDASEVIERNTLRFTSSITDARQTAELFSQGMKNFAAGIKGSDEAIVRAQTKLAETVNTFAQSLGRWSAFEDEIRSFYRSVEAHQKQLVRDGENLSYMLNAYKDVVAKATATLERSAEQITAATQQLPRSFDSAFGDLSHQLTMQTAEIKSSHLQELAKFEERLATLTNPIHRLEDRLRDLSTPFERAARNLEEIATNLWKLNESAVQSLNNYVDQSKASSGKNNSPEPY
jgi:predicted  nucleic acid-binding Zn-ribbon protein